MITIKREATQTYVMPPVDPELALSLDEVSQILLKRPGAVGIKGIKRLSNLYGFETFTDIIDPVNKASAIQSPGPLGMNEKELSTIERLTIAGKIILIDIDFQEQKVSDVSLSLAIVTKLISGKDKGKLNFIDKACEPNIEKLLLQNLNESTLDDFNRNLRLLSLLDKLSNSVSLNDQLNRETGSGNDELSHERKYDLFNYMHILSFNLHRVYEYQVSHLDELDYKSPFLSDRNDISCFVREGLGGIGKVELNVGGRCGVFLKFWEDHRFVTQQLKQRVPNDEIHNDNFLLHFKIKEVDNEYCIKNIDTRIVYKEKWFEEGRWLVDSGKNDNDIVKFSVTLVAELLPTVWVPYDLLYKWNIDDIDEAEPDVKNNRLDALFDHFNKFHHKRKYRLNEKGDQKLEISMMSPCRFVKLHKLSHRVEQIQSIVDDLRTWCVISSFIRNVLSSCESEEETRTNVKSELNVDDVKLVEFVSEKPIIVNNRRDDEFRLSFSPSMDDLDHMLTTVEFKENNVYKKLQFSIIRGILDDVKPLTDNIDESTVKIKAWKVFRTEQILRSFQVIKNS